ncbi:MAG: hypothetical protein HND52_14910 [Ignavibacteriae bacterium]|nr:hypothetical protein [Ignavibacteriota bacterium]NOG99244.1 hypothetical protein [Ignavibacteriota bacterium]
MKTTRNRILIILITIQFWGCSAVDTDVLLRKEFDGQSIAVINFTKTGSTLHSNLGSITADLLTEALFLKGRYNLIDRSKVNEAQLKLEIKSPEYLSKEKITEIGSLLQAKYLILGDININNPSKFISDNNDTEMSLVIRLISTESTTLVGMANSTVKYKDDIINSIKLCVNEIAEGMN